MITSISSYMSDINLNSFFNNENIRHKIMITYLLLDLRRLLVAYTVLKGLGEEFIFALFFRIMSPPQKKSRQSHVVMLMLCFHVKFLILVKKPKLILSTKTTMCLLSSLTLTLREIFANLTISLLQVNVIVVAASMQQLLVVGARTTTVSRKNLVVLLVWQIIPQTAIHSI